MVQPDRGKLRRSGQKASFCGYGSTSAQETCPAARVRTTSKKMLASVVFFSSFIFGAISQNILLEGSCGSLCTCTEKDGVLHINCEERNISKTLQIKVPPSVPFHLNLYKNDIAELHSDDLKDLKNAVSLHLGANNIQELDPGVFNGFESLKKLHINSNFLVALKADTFQGLTNLEYLQADTNFIRVIEPGAFSNLVRLKVLILNDNSIEFLPSNVFRFVPLTHLDLRGNQLQSLPYVGFLEHIGRIMELLLDDNSWLCDCEILPLKVWIENMRAMSSISDVVCTSPPHLRGGNLSKVKRNVLCPSHADLEEPSKPSEAAVTQPPKVIHNPKLMEDEKPPTPVYGQGKSCTERCSCHTHPAAGFLVHCQDRGIQRISDLGLFHQSPTKLVLTGNMIQSLLQYDFVAYEGLELLNLANNRIEFIDNETFLSLGHLKKLYLNGNKLEQLSSGMFVGLHNLEYLYLEYNTIKDILSGTFDTMTNLKLLSLNNNLLQTLPPQIFQNAPLAKLSLRKNLFKHLPVSNVLEHLDSLEQIYLEDNPWDCTCDMISLKQWIEKPGKDAIVGSILCHSPRKIARKELRTLGHEEVCPGLGTFSSLPNAESGDATTVATTPGTINSFFRSLTDTVPLSVLILSLLVLFLMVVFCAAGIVVLVLHRQRRSKKTKPEEQAGETSPIHLQYSMYGKKTTHHLTPRSTLNMYDKPTQSPIIQVCRNPTYCAHNKDHELEEFEDEDLKHMSRGLPEKENDSPLTGPNRRFRSATEYSPEFTTFGDTTSLYRNIIEREREIQQLGLTEYLRKNISQIPPALDIQPQGRHEELKLMETFVYTRPRKVMVEQTQNEYFELKANLHAEPDYLEVLEHQSTFT